MNSDEHSAPYGRWASPPQRPTPRPFPQSSEWSPGAPKPHVNEDTLKQAQVQIERKTYVFSLKENVRGRLLRITEDTGGKRNSIIIPATGLVEFKNLLAEMIKASENVPIKDQPPE